MTLKTFWSLLIKLIGIYLIWQMASLVPSIISLITFHKNYDSSSFFENLFLTTGLGLIIVILIRYCLFNTQYVIKQLRLIKEDEDEKIEVSIHRSSLLTIAIIVLGGFLLADGIPLFGYQLIFYFNRTEVGVPFLKNPATPYLIADLLKVLAGIFMLTDTRSTVNFIEHKRRKAAITEEDETRE